MRRKFSLFIFTLLAIVALWWFGRRLDWGVVRASLNAADWRLVSVAALFICATYVMRAFRWQALLAPLRPTRFHDLFAATTVGFGAIFTIGRTGEILRPAFLSLRDQRVPPTASFVTIGVERIYDMTTIVLLFAANLLWFDPPAFSVARYRQIKIAGLILLLSATLGIVGLIAFKRLSSRAIGQIESASRNWPRFLRHAARVITHSMEQLARALGVLTNKRDLLVTAAWTAFLWGAITFADWLVLRAFGLRFGLSETIFVMGWALVGSMVPTPGGAAGAFHAATAAGLIFLGVEREQAAAVSIVMHLVLFGPALFFGLYYFLRSGTDLARLWDTAEREAEEAQNSQSIAHTQEAKDVSSS